MSDFTNSELKKLSSLKNWGVKLAPKDKSDLMDFEAHFDPLLSLHENKEILRRAYPDLLLQVQTTQTVKDLEEKAWQENKIQFENQLKDSEKVALEALLSRNSASVNDLELENFFAPLNGIYSAFIDSNIPLLIVQSKHGLGKSHHALIKLQESGKPFHVITGKATPIQVFIDVFNHLGEIIVLEDLPLSLLQNRDFLAMLKAMTFSVSGVRRVDWLSSSKVLMQEQVPNSFACTSRFIIICNSMPDNEDFGALKSRGLFYKIPFNPEIIKKLFFSLASLPNSAVQQETRLEVAQFLASEATLGTDLHLRLYFHGLELARVNPNGWKQLLKSQLHENPNLRAFYEALQFSKQRQEQARYFSEATGLSTRTFFRHLEKLGG